MATTAGGLPYVESTDLVSGWPAVSQALAEELDDQLALKAALAGATYTGTHNFSGATVTGLNVRILQALSAAKTDTFSMTSSTYTDVTGLSVAITPASSTNKILVVVAIGAIDASTADFCNIRIVRGSTAIALADTAGSRVVATANHTPAASNRPSPVFMAYLDSPATTSSTTYKVQAQSPGSSLYINRTATDSDSSTFPRTISTITVMEVTA